MKDISYVKIESGSLETLDITSFEEIDLEGGATHWIHLFSPSKEKINELSCHFKINPLVLEKIQDSSELPKLEYYRDYIFMVLEKTELVRDRISSKQISLIAKSNLLISIEEAPSQIFNEIQKKLEARLNVFEIKSDDILYLLLDKLVENYFDILEETGEKIDMVEDELLLNPQKETLNDIYKLKRDLIATRKNLWLMRNAIGSLEGNEFSMISLDNKKNFKGLYDHIVQLVDLIETYRDICSGMLDIYLSSLSNRTNDIMKVLTIFSTLFIPLTFLAGVYGMNFKVFPEIYWKYGYWFFWLLSLIITALMLRFFKKKNWL